MRSTSTRRGRRSRRTWPTAGPRRREAAWGIHHMVNENMARGRAHPRPGARQGSAHLASLRLRRGRSRALLAGRPHPQGAAHPRAIRGGGHVGVRAPGRAAVASISSAPRASASTARTGAPSMPCSARWNPRGGRSWPGRACHQRTSGSRAIAEMRYVGQGHEVEAAIPRGPAERQDISTPSRPASRPRTARSTTGCRRACPSRRSTGA